MVEQVTLLRGIYISVFIFIQRPREGLRGNSKF